MLLDCPDEAKLIDWNSGRLPATQAVRIALHCNACSICQSIVESLGSSAPSHVAPSDSENPRTQESCETYAVDPGHAGAARMSSTSDHPPVAPVATLGIYEIRGQIGRGGMGIVYRAHHPLLKRDVALKVLPALQQETGSHLARFRREIEILGRLDHPNVVAAHDAGEVEGVHYLVMELVRGIDLARLIAERGPIAWPDACEIGRQAALALAYGHRLGLVHRDVKPSNLMLTNDGRVKLLDLGLARWREEGRSGTDLTQPFQVMGTPDYMAPEQASDTRLVDIRADLYSLGCTLFHLLAGCPPYDRPRYSSFLEKITAHAQEPMPPIRTSRPDLPEPLEAVLMKFLAKSPSARWLTPAEAAAALEPWANGHRLGDLLVDLGAADRDRDTDGARGRTEWVEGVETLMPPLEDSVTPASDESSPIRSKIPGQPSATRGVPKTTLIRTGSADRLTPDTSRARRWLRKLSPCRRASRGAKPRPVRRGFQPRRFAVLAAGALVGLLVVMQVIVRVRDRHGRTISGSTYPGGNVLEVTESSGEPTPPSSGLSGRPGTRDQTSPPLGAVVVRETTVREVRSPSAPGPSSTPNCEPLSPVALVREPAPLPGVRGWSIETVRGRRIVGNLPPHHAAFRPDARRLAASTRDGTIRIWDTEGSRLIKALVGAADIIAPPAWSPDGRLLASIDMQFNDVHIWDVEAGRLLWRLHDLNNAASLAWSRDGATLAVGCGAYGPGTPPGYAQLWDVGLGRKIDEVREGFCRIDFVAWSPKDQTLATSERGGFIKLWHPERGEVEGIFRFQGWTPQVAWSPDGATLASFGAGVARLWDAATRQVRTIEGIEGAGALGWSPDGKSLAFGGDVRDAASGKRLRMLGSKDGPPGEVPEALSWSGDGRLWAARRPGQVEIRTADPDRVRWTFREHPFLVPLDLSNLGWSPDGKSVAVLCDDATVRVWDLETGSQSQVLRTPNSSLSLSWSPDGRSLAVGRGELWILDLGSGHVRARTVMGTDMNGGYFWSPDSQTIATASDSSVWLYSVGAETPPRILARDASKASTEVTSQGIAWSHDGKRLAYVASDGIRLVEVASGRVVRTIAGRIGPIAWSPDGESLACVDRTRGNALCLVKADGKTVPQFTQNLPVVRLGWSPDGKLLRAADLGRRVLEWELASGCLRGLAKDPLGYPYFSPGRSLALSCGGGGRIGIWDFETGRTRLVLVPLSDGWGLAISPEGHVCGARPAEREYVYVVETDQGQSTMTPSEFAARYGWKNDPGRARIGQKPTDDRDEKSGPSR